MNPSRRAGFTLAELVVALFLFSLLAGGILTLVMRQQRFYRDTAEVIKLQGNLRQGAAILPLDLRGISTSDVTANSASTVNDADIYSMSDWHIEFRRIFGTSTACKKISTDTLLFVPKQLDSAATMSAWANDPVAGDSILILDEGKFVGAGDDIWRVYKITSVSTVKGVNGCPWRPVTPSAYVTAADTGRFSYKVSVDPTRPLSTNIVFPAPVRLFRRARYEIYQAPDLLWYLGFSDCLDSYATWNSCTEVAPVSGPYRAYTGDTTQNGLVFTYFDSMGVALSGTFQGRQVARVTVKIRTQSDRALTRTGAGAGETFGDSSLLSIGVRNRR